MKTPEDILRSLGDLSSHDREWILARLSPQARKALLDGMLDSQPNNVSLVTPPAYANAQSVADVESRLTLVSPERLAAVLTDEPAWIVHCAICAVPSASRASFERALLENLSAPLRARVMRLGAQRSAYPAAIQKRVCASLIEAIDRQAPVAKRGNDASFLGRTLRELSSRLSSRRLRMRA